MTLPTITSYLHGSNTGSTTLAVTITAPADGDWMLCELILGNTSTTVTTPAGWTLLASGPNDFGSRRSYYYGRIKVTGDTTVSFVKSASVVARATISYGGGGDPVASWQIGAFKARATAPAESSTVSRAPSITTGETDVMAIAFISEATTTTEGSSATISGTGWTQGDALVQLDATTIEQIHVAYKAMAASGATGDVQYTYPNTQANNGAGIQFGITPSVSGNAPPTAAFTHVETYLHVAVDGTTSTDSDGTITAYSWDWGDGSTDSTGSTSTHDYADPGTYTITLTVTDNGSATDDQTHNVTVLEHPGVFIYDDPVVEARIGDDFVTHAYIGDDLVWQFVYTVDDMLVEPEIRVAWRGLGDTYTEMTPAGYAAAVAAGFKVLECSVNYSSDGVPVLIHNDTVDAMTNGTGTVASKTWATLQGLTVDVGSGGDGVLHRLEEILDLYAENYVLFIDDKTNTHSTQMLALLATYPNPTKHFVWKGFRGWSPAADVWTAAGYQAWGIYYDIDSGVMGTVGSPHSSVAHFTMLGLNWDANQSPYWDDAVAIAAAQDKRLLAHVVHSSGNATTARGKGADGLMTGVAL